MVSGAQPRLGTEVHRPPSVACGERLTSQDLPIIALALVVDRVAYGQLLARGFDSQGNLRCVAVSTSVDDVIAAAEADVPAVVVVEVSRDTLNVASLKRLTAAWPSAHLVVLTDMADPASTVPLAHAGAAALLPREAPFDEIVRIVRCVGDGMVLVSTATLDAARTRLRGRQTTRMPHRLTMTPRENDVLRLLADGNRISTIARELGISINTCRGHLKSMMTKLGAHSQLELVLLASRAGLHGTASTPQTNN